MSVQNSATILAKDSSTARSSPRCQQTSPGVKLCLCLLASFSWCWVGYANTKLVPWCQAWFAVRPWAMRTGSHPTSYRFVQSRIHFFYSRCLWDTVSSHLHMLLWSISHVYSLAFRTRECFRNLYDGLWFSWCFPGEILGDPLNLCISMTKSTNCLSNYNSNLTNPSKSLETGFVDFTFSDNFNFCGHSE